MGSILILLQQKSSNNTRNQEVPNRCLTRTRSLLNSSIFKIKLNPFETESEPIRNPSETFKPL